jgi:hypothetical protein
LQLKWDFCNLIHDPSHYKTSIEHHRVHLFYIFVRELGSHYANEEVSVLHALFRSCLICILALKSYVAKAPFFLTWNITKLINVIMSHDPFIFKTRKFDISLTSNTHYNFQTVNMIISLQKRQVKYVFLLDFCNLNGTFAT